MGVPYHPSVLQAIRFVLPLALVFLGSEARAQCDDPMASFPEAVHRIEREIAPIFKKLGLSLGEAVVKTGEGDRRIVPGKRAGAFEIGAGEAELAGKVRLSTAKKKSDARYAYILPLGYVPERIFRASESEKMTFVFNVMDRTLSEILVHNPEYKTDGGVRVGETENLLKERGWKVHTATDETHYYQKSGITIVCRKNEIIEIAVIRAIYP